jgi:hypothetical protein
MDKIEHTRDGVKELLLQATAIIYGLEGKLELKKIFEKTNYFALRSQAFLIAQDIGMSDQELQGVVLEVIEFVANYYKGKE